MVRLVNGQRSLAVLKWGLIPYNNKRAEPDRTPTMIRDDTILTNPFSRAAVKYRRCIIPIDKYVTFGKLQGVGRVPITVRMTDDRLFSVAGIWELWMSPSKEKVETAALITVEACDAVYQYNNRMPAILDEAAQERWLDHSIPAEEAIKELTTYSGSDILCELLRDEQPPSLGKTDSAQPSLF